jgi:hypothetical protein
MRTPGGTPGEPLGLGRCRLEAGTALANPVLGTTDELPAIDRRLAEDPGDLVVAVIEHPAQKIGRPLDGREALEHDQQGQRHGLGHLEPLTGFLLPGLDHGLREPRAHI